LTKPFSVDCHEQNTMDPSSALIQSSRISLIGKSDILITVNRQEPVMNPQKRLWPILRNCLITGVTSLCIASCAGPSVYVPVQAQVAEKVKNTDVLQTCAVLADQDMAEIRGCYDNIYAFGLDFIGTIDFASTMKMIEGKVFAYAVALKGAPLNTPDANFANGKVEGGGVAFEAGNGQVNFHSSVGQSHLGTGVIQLVQVMGNNNLVIASTNVTLNIKNFQTIKPAVTGRGGFNFLNR
jgi:hypothetical protein